jgi:hypothetical protein
MVLSVSEGASLGPDLNLLENQSHGYTCHQQGLES